jgi:replication-associated recombination protein RarA
MDRLAKAKNHLANRIDPDLPELKPLNADQWIANSLLQKSIRRGEVEVAQMAALSFFRQRGSALWRRLIIVAFEDVGVGFPDAVVATVAASTDASWRKRVGGDALVACHLARLLAEASKSRSTEHLPSEISAP